MNTPNPLVPQGTAPAGGKSTVRNVVLGILVVHVALISGMLIQGCSEKTPKTPGEDPAVTAMSPTNDPYYPTDTNVQPIGGTDVVASATSNDVIPEIPPLGATAAPSVTSNVAVPVPAPIATPIATPVVPVIAAPAGTEYTVVANDAMINIAKKHNVSLKALQAANPGVDPRKIRPGQKLQIPAPSAPVAALVEPVSLDSSAPAAQATVYTVKAGDALARIARTHHTTVKAIVALNNLKTQTIQVGQKLKIPAAKKAAAPSATEAAPISAAAAPAFPLSPVAN